MPILDDLFGHARRTTALEQAAGILGWDRETMMPPDGAGQRAEQSAAMSAAIHARHSDPKVGEWLGELDASTLAPTEARSVELIARKYQRATRVSEDLASHLARTTSRAQGIWVEARRADQFAEFKPMLAEIVALKREEAACLVRDGGTLYDALLWDFEPGFTSANLDPIFAKLRASLSDLRGRIAGSGRDVPVLDGHFPHSAQMALARKIAPVLGYDLKGGRIDLAVHPFCAGSGGDVRITTRVDERDPLNCLYSSMHEMGHAIYKQNIPRDLALDPLGGDDAMGPHESQSRLIENQIGRSRSFATYLWPMLTETFGDFGLGGPDAWYRAVNRVETGYIRTEADEVHYNLHIILRYGLERDLIEGRLEVDDLEEAWNSQFLADFGLAVDRPSNGVLQDVHWSAGLFGYFPTYTLGNIYAGELFAGLGRDMPDLQSRIAAGDLGDVLAWLTDRIHRHGARYDPLDLIEAAVGHAPTPEPLITYLEAKFSDLYDL